MRNDEEKLLNRLLSIILEFLKSHTMTAEWNRNATKLPPPDAIGRVDRTIDPLRAPLTRRPTRPAKHAAGRSGAC